MAAFGQDADELDLSEDDSEDEGFRFSSGYFPGEFSEPQRPYNETQEYGEALPGEYATTWYITWAPRYINVSDVANHDDSYSARWLTGQQWLGARTDVDIDYRSSPDTRITQRYGIGASYTYQEFSSHEMFRLHTLDQTKDMPARLESSLLSVDISGMVGYRYKRFETFFEMRALAAWRFRRVSASKHVYTDTFQGFIDNLESPTRNETRLIQMYQWGIGTAWHIGDDPTNFRLATTFRPYNFVQWGERYTYTSGFGFEFRSGGLRLSDDLEIAFGTRFDFWLPNDELNDIFQFEFSIGLRFS